MPDDMPGDKDQRRDDTELRRVDTEQRAADTEQRAADTEQRGLDTTTRSDDTAARKVDRAEEASRRKAEATRQQREAQTIAEVAAVHVRQAQDRAEISRQDIVDLIEKAQTRRRKQALALSALLVFVLVFGFWRAERADRGIRENDRERCLQLADGFAQVNAANEDKSKNLPVPDCR